ncbi:MAG: hypothetical protein LH613_04220 [Chamaesiphon sp.]|nr:hypothetical protein [Chamaesiphon sp.]
MLNDIETKNNLGAVPPIQILLAESDPAEIARIRANIDREFQRGIKVAKNYDELLERITEQQPQLVILGRIDKFNYLDLSRECHKIQQDLSIVLLSQQRIISESFRQLVKTCGLTDVINQDPTNLNQLFQAFLDRPVDQLPTDRSPQPTIDTTSQQPINRSRSEPPIDGQMMLAGLEEIVAISSRSFGALAQGNYWRKTHDRIVDEFPFASNWSADHFGKLSCHANILEQELTAEDIQSLRVWVQLFIGECERIIIDFEAMLNDSARSLAAKHLLIKP